MEKQVIQEIEEIQEEMQSLQNKTKNLREKIEMIQNKKMRLNDMNNNVHQNSNIQTRSENQFTNQNHVKSNNFSSRHDLNHSHQANQFVRQEKVSVLSKSMPQINHANQFVRQEKVSEVKKTITPIVQTHEIDKRNLSPPDQPKIPTDKLENSETQHIKPFHLGETHNLKQTQLQVNHYPVEFNQLGKSDEVKGSALFWFVLSMIIGIAGVATAIVMFVLTIM